MKPTLQRLLGILLLSGWGYCVQAQVTNIDTGEMFATIQAAIDDADTDNGDVLDLGTATYTLTTSVIVNKALTIRGNGGNIAARPIVEGNGNAIEQTLFLIDATNVTIENINFRVALTGNSLHAIRATTFDNLRLLNNLIESTGTTFEFDAYGIRLESADGTGQVTIVGNTITRENAAAADFGRGIRMLGGSGTIGGMNVSEENTIRGTYTLQMGNAGNFTIQNNDLTGLVEFALPQATADIQIIDNTITDGDLNTFLIEVKDNTQGGIVNIEGNILQDFEEVGIFIARSDSVTISNNTFTPEVAPATYTHILLNTKQRTNVDASTQTAFSTEAIIIGNTFNGNGVANGRGIVLGNHNDVCDFGEVQIGGPDAEANIFRDDITTYIELDNSTGSSATNPLWSGLSAASQTTMTPVSQSFNATQNLFDVTGSGMPLRFNEMSDVQQADLETKLTHRPDQAVLGRLLPADGVPALVINNLNITNVTCQGDTDGAVSGTVAGGEPTIVGVYAVEIDTDPVQSVLTTDGSFTFTGLAQQSYTISVNDLSLNTLSRNINVGAPAIPNIVTSGDVTIVRTESKQLSAEAIGAVSYSWSPTVGLDNPDIATPTASPQETTTYTVTVSDGACTYEESLTVTVIDAGRIALPNIFFPERTDTPNNTFVATGEGIESITLRIYNRLGQEVYRSDDWNQIQDTGWDGKVGGTIQNSEAYVWYIAGKFVDGRDLETIDGKQTGTVILMR